MSTRIITGFLLLVNAHLFSQITPKEACESGIQVQVGSGIMNSISLTHAGMFLFIPTNGQKTMWEISTTDNPTTIKKITSTPWLVELAPLGLSTSDSIVVDLTVTNTTGDICVVRDTLIWTVVSIVINTPIYSWKGISLPANSGTFTPGTSSIDDINRSQNSFKISPNPSQGKVSLQMDHVLASDAQVDIFNTMGQKINVDLMRTNHSQIDFELLDSGIYWIRILYDGEMHTQRLIVAK